jgi:competence protein ComFC
MNMPLAERIISIFAPHFCEICAVEGEILCTICMEAEILRVPARCYRCFRGTPDSTVCDKCKRQSPLKNVWVRAVYDNKTGPLLIKYKFERARSSYRVFAHAIAGALPYLTNETVVVPVPSSTERIRQRGYDHAQLIAKELAYIKGYSYARPGIRFGQAHQFGSSRKKRLMQLEGVFLVTKPHEIKGKQILIVDDVLTTGATLETYARVLKKAGAKQVRAAVFAQKI